MYKIKIDSDTCYLKEKIADARSLLEAIGEEPNDCVLVSEDNVVFKGNVDLSINKTFKTAHPSFIPYYWQVVD